MQDTFWKDLGSVLEHLGVSSEPFLEIFWGSFGQSDWGPLQQNSVFCCHGRCSNDFLLSEAFRGGFWVVFGSTFGSSELLFYSTFCRSELDVSIVVVALCTSHTHLRHFASQLTVSTTSGISLITGVRSFVDAVSRAMVKVVQSANRKMLPVCFGLRSLRDLNSTLHTQ